MQIALKCVVIALVLAGCRTAEVPRHLDLPQLRVDLPEGWVSEAPTSTMRTAQVQVSSAEGEAEMAVFHFGEGKGGSVADNIRRWISEVEFSPGSSVHREEFGANGYTVYMVDFEGTLKSSMKGGGRDLRQENARVLGAIIEGPGGPWYFKLTGPNAIIEPRREDFLRMLESVRPREDS